MTHPIKSPRKLIEVALPTDIISAMASAEKQPFTRRHPRSLHIWWARRPFTAARAVIFSQLVNDPSWKWELEHPEEIPPSHLKASWAASRKRLFKIMEDLINWKNTTDENVMERARKEIRHSWHEVCELNKNHPQAAELFNSDVLPGLHDPFCGGGAIPLEAQRLGLEAHASDLNPVAVLITKAMIEIPPRFADRVPVGPLSNEDNGRLALRSSWPRATGLIEDVRRYGEWLRTEARKRIGELYPAIIITSDMAQRRSDLKELVGMRLEVIAWLWARTVKSPNPAFSHVDVPLISSFVLSNKSGNEVFLQPELHDDNYNFFVQLGKPPRNAKNGTKIEGRGANFRCILSGAPISPQHIRNQGQAGQMGTRLLTIIADGPHGLVYLPPSATHEALANNATPEWAPDLEFFQEALGFRVGKYGMTKWSDLFTRRQLVAIATFGNLIKEAQERAYRDAVAAGFSDDQKLLVEGGSGATAYSEAVAVYLGLALSRWADLNNTICTWNSTNNNVRALFSRQAIPMAWDFAELSAFSPTAGYDSILKSYSELSVSLPASIPGFAVGTDAQKQILSSNKVISTDPPYYDNIGYADLSDFFYVWLRRFLRPILPDLFSTITVPKQEELVATPFRHGGKEKAERFFLDGMTQAMRSLAVQAHPAAAPVTIYYAFKQTETDSESGTSSKGWETFLEAVLTAGFQVTGTWPLRTERAQRSRGIDSNALASSVILVCRIRPIDSPAISRRQFLRELNSVLPQALDEMTRGSGDERSPIAPVDLSQAIIGPGMAVFSKYSAVIEADGSPMSIRTALQLINRFLAEDDFDADTQFCLHWFEQNGWNEGGYGDADTLSRAKGASVDGMRDSGIVQSGGGIVRLRKWSEYLPDWNPDRDTHNSVWETLHHLIRALKQEGETQSGSLLFAVKEKSEAARQLAYRLYTLCERKGWAEDARAYNEVVTSWSGIESAANAIAKPAQGGLFEQDI